MSGDDDDVLDLLLSSGGENSEVGEEGDRPLNLSVENDDETEVVGIGDRGAAASSEAVQTPTDDELRFIQNKADAKEFGPEVYKRWKKLQRRLHRAHGGEDDRRGKPRKRSKSRRSTHKTKEGKRGSRKSKRNRDDIEHHSADVEVYEGFDTKDGVRHSREKRRRKSSRTDYRLVDEGIADTNQTSSSELLDSFQQDYRSGVLENRTRKGTKKGTQLSSTTTNGARPKKLSVEAQQNLLNKRAAAVVDAMRKARVDDKCAMAGNEPPLQRVRICDRVAAYAHCRVLQRYLIENGILQELSTWLYDFERRELAPYELRTAALDILLSFPIQGELEGTVLANGDEIIDDFTGMTRDHLFNTDLGAAVNKVREDKDEIHENRAKAVLLMGRLSRAMAGGVSRAGRRGWTTSSARSPHDAGDELSGNKKALSWKCQGDPTVAPPFHIVQTATEVFQRALAQPDPLDPLSYLRTPSWRPPKPTATNVSQ
ncbi:hypothetical protein, conserved [Trypanosoma brucei gambiense DAL972]|uniref:TFIIS N-terminal domain-containing protein n=1 Tax=Trypanosoma brucei gambiense (strain MHOM/CI/86/DAL972) TaxID=679716 RepID=C9ZRL3_TRYB9|nr:hypothetical protein, conserved [Trypanosoma brucei gambiense DAL972]CBH12315.1 hypothetical protein, conserved [Trypanosoma brucei gambiense DAL972]|eukprot:XP_011774596.1 hypothetical protein, conserved [Trypanosoma brucei gambiense DAL972]